MKLKRIIVNTGKEVSEFFAQDLQNHYYKFLFLEEARKYIGTKRYTKNHAFENEAIDYWKKRTGLRINTIWHDYYSSVNGIKDVRYVPENIYYAYIEPFYNRKDFCQCCDDKCYYTERFPVSAVPGGVRRPPTILRNISGLFFDKDFNILSEHTAAELVSKQKDGYVIKESITGTGGNRLIFVEPGTQKSIDDILTIFQKYKKDYVIEGLVTQCDELKALNPTSINTIRFITFMDNNGVHILSAVLRIGGKGARTDNFSTGGMACGIDDNGKLKTDGYDQQYNKYHEIHPNGIHFAGVQVPGYEEAKTFVKTLHRRFGHFRIISWDIVIDKDHRPLIIEFNLTPQGIDLHQINNGPLFGDLTDQILQEVFRGKK